MYVKSVPRILGALIIETMLVALPCGQLKLEGTDIVHAAKVTSRCADSADFVWAPAHSNHPFPEKIVEAPRTLICDLVLPAAIRLRMVPYWGPLHLSGAETI